jgi:hypothetical protein
MAQELFSNNAGHDGTCFMCCHGSYITFKLETETIQAELCEHCRSRIQLMYREHLTQEWNKLPKPF